MFTPRFIITNKILTNVGKIEAAREVIENSPLVPAWEAKFREEAVVRQVHFGTHIEGNDLTLNEAADVLAGKEIAARERDVQEVLNYRAVIDYINREGTKGRSVDKEILLQIHRLTVTKLVPKAEVGSFRIVAVVVRGVKTGQVTYTPPAAKEIDDQANEVIEWVNSETAKDISPLLRAGVLMYEIVRIHPFTEGNGRTARALATLLLFKEDYDVKRFFSLEEYYDEGIGAYYDALQSASNQLITNESDRDLTSWLEYFIEGLAIEINRIKDKVKKLSVDLRLKGRQGQIALNERQIKLIEYMDQYGQITGGEWRELLPMVSDDTILREMKEMIKKKVVKKRGSTKGAIYVLR